MIPADLLESHVRRLAGHLLLIAPGIPFLESHARALAGDDAQDPAALRARLAEEGKQLEQHAAEIGPLAQLFAHHRVSRFEVDVLLFSLLPEIDDRFGDVFASLRGAAGARRPTLGVALRALFTSHAERWHARRHLEGSPLWEAGLLKQPLAGRADAALAGPERPGMDTVLWPSAPVVAAAFGHLPARLDGGAEVRAEPPVDAREELREGLAPIVAELGRWIETVQSGIVHLTCESLADGAVIASALARSFGRPLLSIAGVGAQPEAALQQAVQCATIHSGVLAIELEGVEALHVPASFRSPGPVVLVSTSRCDVRLSPGLAARRVTVPRPRPAEQATLWRAALGDAASAVKVDVLANRTTLGAGQIRAIAARATEQARAAGRAGAAHEDVLAALVEAVPDPASPLARASAPKVAWTKLVLDRETRSQVEDLVLRIENRVTVQEVWGLSGNEGRGEGLVAMFHGEPGTGKTLAAEAIAARLGLSLWRVDLSRVVSKYIGETEKQLSALFDSAEGFRAVLFFDEADTLFSRRTGVRDAHDRYANLETNYLLSRLEAFEGLAILATNLLQNVDSAFMRRVSFIVPFPRPTAAQRQKLWLMHLPRERLSPEVDLEALASQHDLTGGEIRSAALSAAYAAAAAGSPVTPATIDQAIRAERLKTGKAVRRDQR